MLLSFISAKKKIGVRCTLNYDLFDWILLDIALVVIGLGETTGKECYAGASRHLWGEGP